MKERVLAILVIMSLLLVGCSGIPGTPSGTTEDTTSRSETPTQKPESVTIKIICSSGGSGKTLSGGVEAFNVKNDGKIKAEIEMVANESLLERCMMQFISKEAFNDVLASDKIPATAPYFAPLNTYFERDGVDAALLYGKGILDTATVDGTVRMLPFRSQVNVIYYRGDLFDQAGLDAPTTLEKYLEAARKLTIVDSNNNVVQYGTSLEMQSPAWTIQTFANFFMPLGGFFLTEDLKHASESLKSELAYDVMRLFKTLQDEKLIPDPLSWTYDDNVLAMQTGKVTFSIEPTSRSALMENPNSSQVVGKMRHTSIEKLGIGPHPGSDYSSIWCLGIDKNSKNTDAAWEFVKFVCSYEQQKVLAVEFSNSPSVLKIYDDADFKSTNPVASLTKKLLGELPRYAAPIQKSAQVELIVHEELQSYMLDRQDEVTAGTNMFNRIETLVTTN